MASAAAAQPSSLNPPTEDEAPIALMVDMTSGQVLFARNPDRRFLPASMTKTMTVFLAFEMMQAGQLDPRTEFVVSEEVWSEWYSKGSTMFLELNDTLTVGQLLGGIANVSANDGSIVLATGASGSVEAWVKAMNAKAHEIGMVNSHFGTPNGWPDEGKTFTTARDLSILAEAMIRRHPELFRTYVGQSEFTYAGITQPNRDPLLGKLDGADGIKTGFTSESGFGFLGTAKQDGQRLIMVLGGVERNAERARLARAFMRWGFENFDRKRFFAKGAPVGTARVQGGTQRSVPLVTDREVFANFPKDQQSQISVEVVYDGPVRSPISKGDEIAMLRLNIPGMKPAMVPLLAGEDVGEAGILDRIWNGFAGWFA